ncbi:MAG: sigma-54 dependent transcriptional regulator [Planctomycetota bacterium]|nr:sigma-54 dependent transcriptional regulator [Planctomycetota bacterium]
MLRESLAELLGDEGFTVLQAANGREVQQIILKEPVDLVLSDIRMPEMDGMTLLAYLRHAAPETLVMMITAYGTVQNAVAAMRAGACDYLLKPIQFEDLLVRIQRALASRDIVRTQRVITEQLASESTFHNLVGHAPSMTRLFEMVRKLSAVKSNAIIIGESGTGKELFARAIHYNGVTRDKPFVAVNSGAIPITLMESELFGYRRGAFTGATRDKVGFFEAANGGTLFLDEISVLPPSIQSSLLRVVEVRAVVPVGDTRPRPVDVRIIAASNQDLEKQVARGEFREDLLYRLNVVKLELPPLRNRREDIPLLVSHFLKKYSETLNRQVTGITNGAMRAMLGHEWRGNVRELENVIERAVIFAENRQIGVEDLPFATTGMTDDIGEDLKEALNQFERQHILHSLRRHHYDKVETARNLGIGVSSLYRKMEELAVPKNLDEQGDTDRPMAPEPDAQP